MCFTIGRRSPKIAKKDIKVYKLLYSDLTSPWYDFQYELNKEYEVYFKVELDHYTYESIISEGLHSFSRQFFIAYKKEPRKLFKAIIPKGSTYYKNLLTGEMVSTKLKVISCA